MKSADRPTNLPLLLKEYHQISRMKKFWDSCELSVCQQVAAALRPINVFSGISFEEAKSEEPYEFWFLFNQLYFYFVFLSSILLQINLIAFRFYSAFADFGLGESALKMTKKA